MNFRHYLKKIVPLIFATIFFASGLLITSVQCVLYYTLRFYDKSLYRKINYYLCYSLFSEVLCLCEWWTQFEINLYTDQNDFNKYLGKEHAFLISNHTYELDWVMLPIISDKVKLLPNFKAYAKKSIQYIPVFGWMLKFAEYIFLERNFEKDKTSILKQIQELGSYEDPIWVILFPEGTRYMQAKHEASLKYSREKGLPEFKHHLQPRTRGFTVSLKPMRDNFGAIYDVLVAFDETRAKPKTRDILHGEKIVAHVYLKRIPLEEIPEGEERLEQFLRDLFVKKDLMKESFLKTGDFFETSGVSKVNRIELKRSYYSLINMTIWFLVVFCPLTYYLIFLLLNGDFLHFGLIAAFITISNMSLNRGVGMSSMEKASSYGIKNN